MEKYLGYEWQLIMLGEKLNGFKPARSLRELEKIKKMAEEWINQHPGESYNFYK